MKLLADFCVKAGMKVIQILPVFDTMNTMTWVDSYPYGAITVFALHPMYCNISAVPGCNQEILDEIDKTRAEMIVDPIEVDYQKVVDAKMGFLKRIYELEFTKNPEQLIKTVKEWTESSPDIGYWIAGYCVFKYLSDVFKTVDFNKWTFTKFYDNDTFLKSTDEKKKRMINALFNNKKNVLTAEEHKNLMFYAWMQM